MHTVTINGVDYDVLFDGAHDGRDSDLLTAADRVSTKYRPLPRSANTDPAVKAVFAVLPHDAPHAINLHEICRRTALSKTTVYHAIHALRLEGTLAVVGIPGPGRFPRYWRAA